MCFSPPRNIIIFVLATVLVQGNVRADPGDVALWRVDITHLGWMDAGAHLSFSVAPERSVADLRVEREGLDAPRVALHGGAWVWVAALAAASSLALRRRSAAAGLALVLTAGVAWAGTMALSLPAASREWTDATAARTLAYRYRVLADGRASEWAVLLPDVPGAITPIVAETPLPTPRAEVDLRVERIFLQQAVPRALGGDGPGMAQAPMVAGRETLLRVVVGLDAAAAPLPRLGGRLRCYLAGRELTPPLDAELTDVPALSAEALPDRTLDFRIPPGWAAPGLEIAVELDPGGEIADSDRSNNRYPASGTLALDLLETAPLRLVLVPVRYRWGAHDTLPPTDELEWLTDFLWATFPIGALELSLHEPLEWAQELGSGGAGWGELLGAVSLLRAAENGLADVFYYGLVDPGYVWGAAGMGWVSRSPEQTMPVSVGTANPGHAGATMAHELGHNHGRWHVDCGGAAGLDEQYPYASGGIGVPGWDPRTGAILGAKTHRDLMSYCGPAWISDYQSRAIFDFRQALSASDPPVAPASAARDEPVGGSLYVQGTVQGGQVRSLQVLRLSEQAPLAGTGDWTIEVGSGGQRTQGSFELVPMDHAPDVLGFSLRLPAPAGPVDSMRILERGAVRHSRQAAHSTRAARPAVGKLRHDASAGSLLWDEPALASAELRRVVRVSYDGGRSFQALALQTAPGRLDGWKPGSGRPDVRRTASGSQTRAQAGPTAAPLLEVQLCDELDCAVQRLQLAF
jgi:hypothetical protein